MSLSNFSEHERKRQFALEGRFAGFVPHTKKPFKYLSLTTADGEYCIKLPKYLQLEVVARFTPGDWVQVVGTCKQRSDGTFRFKAENLVQAKPTAQRLEVPVSVESANGKASSEAVLTPEHPFSIADTKPDADTAADTTADKKRPVKILVCGKSKCMKRGGRAVCQSLEALSRDQNLSHRVTIKQTGCMDRCKSGPNLVIMPDKAKYSHVTPEMVEELLDRHLQD
ncbi:MAG: (2Fe-2S) ferredoxin domain-containing protein [Leptolyngbyaceae bacterium]|nr:(2Fe-2S) ferredoxin domain-containing protein [Leptolyngbyaceae bacterium]